MNTKYKTNDAAAVMQVYNTNNHVRLIRRDLPFTHIVVRELDYQLLKSREGGGNTTSVPVCIHNKQLRCAVMCSINIYRKYAR
jgi:hypothetical protein